MFDKEIYVRRRRRLKTQVGSGLIFLPGNDEAPMNYRDNTYPFRQDSTFLYFFGLDQPGLAAVIDLDDGTECVFGDDPTVEEIVWTGPLPLLRDRCEQVGVTRAASRNVLEQVLGQALRQKRTVHVLPPIGRNTAVCRMMPRTKSPALPRPSFGLSCSSAPSSRPRKSSS